MTEDWKLSNFQHVATKHIICLHANDPITVTSDKDEAVKVDTVFITTQTGREMVIDGLITGTKTVVLLHPDSQRAIYAVFGGCM